MNIAENQGRTFLRLAAELRPHWRTDPALPRTIQARLSGERRFGSRDRRLYRELLYTTLRYLPWIEPSLERDSAEALRRLAWLVAESPATKAFCAEYAKGEPPAGDRAELLPAWFRDHCPEIFSGEELAAQLRRAPLWLRLQADESETDDVLEEFADHGWQWRRPDFLPSAVEILSEVDITPTAAWREGLVEVQDLGSQLILASIGIPSGTRWLDACAGAGGKTLQLARLVGPRGHVDAHDIRPAALTELIERARRARMTCHLLNETSYEAAAGSDAKGHSMDATASAPITAYTRAPTGSYDGVLVDAPCSGSGTWRRFPHLKWSTTPQLVAHRAALQQKLLGEFAPRVRSGGTLVYATCSLSRHENEDVAAAFLAAHPEFQPADFANTFGFTPRGNGLTIMPSRHDTDGFFVALFRRK